MESFFNFLPLAGCVAMSLVCHRLMARSGGSSPRSSDDEVAALRAELAALRDERASAVGPS